MAIDEADRQELVVARDIRDTLHTILEQLQTSGLRTIALAISIDPPTLAALKDIFGGLNPSDAAMIADLTAKLKEHTEKLKTAVDAQQPPAASQRP